MNEKAILQQLNLKETNYCLKHLDYEKKWNLSRWVDLFIIYNFLLTSFLIMRKKLPFYFNARVDEESTSLSGRDKCASLNDGIVKVKREIQTNILECLQWWWDSISISELPKIHDSN